MPSKQFSLFVLLSKLFTIHIKCILHTAVATVWGPLRITPRSPIVIALLKVKIKLHRIFSLFYIGKIISSFLEILIYSCSILIAVN